MAATARFIPSQHPRNPSSGRFVRSAFTSGLPHSTAVTGTGRVVPVVGNPAAAASRRITSGMPGGRIGRQARDANNARRVTSPARHGMVGKINANGGVDWNRRGPKR